MINTIFNLCVAALVWLADLLGLSYQAINVFIFVVIWPLFTVLLIWVILRQRRAMAKFARLKS